MPNSDPYIRRGQMGLLPIENVIEGEDIGEIQNLSRGFFSKLFSSKKPENSRKINTFKYVLYPIETGKVYTMTKNRQYNAYRAARQARFI
jgi:hypothetical protein